MKVPLDAELGEIWSRLRITSEANTPLDMQWFGFAMDGEVMDRTINIKQGSTEPVYLQGDTLVIRGSAMDDVVSITRDAGKIVVVYNGNEKSFTTTSNVIREVKVDGYQGKDTVTYTDNVKEVHDVLMSPYNATITSGSLKVVISNVSNISYVGNSLDVADMRDSEGDDTVVLGKNTGTMEGPGRDFVNKVDKVYQIQVSSIHGGNDKLTLNGTDSADQFMSWLNTVSMSDVGVVKPDGKVEHDYFNQAFGFTDVTVNAVADPNKKALDVATIFEKTPGSTNLKADPETARVVRSNTKPEEALNLTLNMFNTINVTAEKESTKLSASLTGSAGVDALVASDTQVNLTGKRPTDSMTYSIQVNHFANCVVDGGAGKDTVSYVSGKGGEHLTVMNDQKTVELFSSFNAMDEALLKMIAFESLKFDAAKNKSTVDLTSINKALIDIDLIGDWIERNR